jgi:hypothetical protein
MLAMAIDRLIEPSAYLQQRTQLFRSLEGLNWFIRRNKARLVQAGALTIPNGRWLIDAERFDGVVAELGAERASEAVQ